MAQNAVLQFPHIQAQDPDRDLVTEAWEEADQAVSERVEAYKQYYRNYRQVYTSDEENQYTNNVFSTITVETIHTFRPFIVQHQPNIRYAPREFTDIPLADKLSQWQQYQWAVQKMQAKKRQMAFNTLLYGFSPQYCFYRKNTRQIEVPSRFGGGRKRVDVYDDPDCRVICPIYDFRTDPAGNSIDSCIYAMYRYYISKEEFRRCQKGPFPWFTDPIDPDTLGTVYSAQDLESRLFDMDKFQDSKQINIFKERMIEIMEYWEDDRLVIVANRWKTVRPSGPNPYWALKKKPFFITTDEDNPHELFGMGEGEILSKAQHEQNTIKRMRIDAVKRLLRPGFMAPPGSGFDPSTYYQDEGYIVEANIPDFIKPLINYPLNIEQIGLPTLAESRSETDNATGANPLFKGGAFSNDTATGKRIQQTNMMARANYKLDNFNLGLADWMQINIGLAMQFYPEFRVFRILNDQGAVDFTVLFYEELMTPVDIEVESASARPTTREDRLMEAEILFTRFNQDAFTDQYKLRQTVHALSDFSKYGLLKPLEQVMKEQQAAAEAAQDAADKESENEIAMKAMDALMAAKEKGGGAKPGKAPPGQEPI